MIEGNGTGGRCPPGHLGFFALELETAGACQAGEPQSDPLFTSLQAGTQVASTHSFVLGWSAADPTPITRPHNRASALVSFCPPSLLLLTTNCLLLLSRMSPFARTATPEFKARDTDKKGAAGETAPELKSGRCALCGLRNRNWPRHNAAETLGLIRGLHVKPKLGLYVQRDGNRARTAPTSRSPNHYGIATTR